jgi:uncharacterized protein (TIGR03066 family)
VKAFLGSILVSVVVVVLAAAPALAEDKPKDLIVGKWKPTGAGDPAPVIEFMKDGKLIVMFGDMKIEGKYKFTADKTFELEMTFNNETKKETITIATITKDEMSGKDSKGKEEKFTRVK